MNKKEQQIFDKQASNLYENYLLDATILDTNAKPNSKVKKLTNVKLDATNDANKIVSYESTNAKELIKSLMNTKIKNNEIAFSYCVQFVEEDTKYFVKCYTIEDKNKEILAFVLLRECDFDPYATAKHKQIKPFMLYYIYTFENHRRNNYAYRLLQNITEEITAFVNCEASENLFKKANFEKYISKNYQYITIYRTKS